MALESGELDAMVHRFLDRVRQRVPVTAVYLYGSYANGGADDDSDIDLAVISPEFGRNRYREMVMLTEACLPDSLLVEAVPFSLTSYEDPPRGSFIREVLRTGRRVA